MKSEQEKSPDDLLTFITLLFLQSNNVNTNILQVEEEEYKTVGLRPRHAYSVLDVRDLSGIKLLRLRNPWGHFSWKGTWSDKSDIWTNELRDELLRECNS